MIPRVRSRHGVWLPGALLLAWTALLALLQALQPELAADHAWRHAALPNGGTLAALALAGVSLIGAQPLSHLGRVPRLLVLAALLGLALNALFQFFLGGTLHDSLRPVSALALILGGVVLALPPRVGRQGDMLARQFLLQLQLTTVLLAAGAQLLNGMIGFDLFEFRGQAHAPGWAEITGLALFWIGTGLDLGASPGVRDYYQDRQDRQVFSISALLLLLMACAAWVVGGGVFASQTMGLFHATLKSALAANSSLFTRAVQQTELRADQATRLSGLLPLLRQPALPPANDPRLTHALRAVLDAGQRGGLAAVWVAHGQGTPLGLAGEPARRQLNRVRVGAQAWLFWDEDFWIEVRQPVRSDHALDEPPVELVFQSRLNGLGTALNQGDSLGGSGEVVVCADQGNHIACYPSRLQPEGARLPWHQEGRPLASALALRGHRGTGIFRDARDHSVIAAYAPLPELGLGIVQKADTGDIPASLLPLLGMSGLAIGMLVLVGAVFLYRRVRPMVATLADTGERLQEAQRIGRLASWEFDPASGTVHWSSKVHAALGLPPTLVLKQIDQLVSLIPDDQQAMVMRALDAALREGQFFDLEHDFVLPDGTSGTWHVQGQVFRDADGAPLRMVGITRDVTERARAEARLRRRETLLNETQRIAHLGGWEWRPDSDELLWSDETYRLFGFLPGAVTPSRTLFESLILPQDLPEVRAALEGAVAHRDARAYEMRIARPDGSLRYLRGHAEFIAGEAGQTDRVFGTHLDVTERVEAEQRLVQMARLFALLSKANQAIVRIAEPDLLLETICRIAVNEGGMRMTWTCQVDEHGKRARIRHFGHEDGYVAAALDIYDRLGNANGPTAQVARQGGHAICDDVATDPRLAPWRELALARGYRASAAFSVQIGGRVVALLNLYAAEPHAFTPEIVNLLDDLCQDVAFAIEARQQAELRQKAEAELRALNEELEWRVTERTRALEDANRELESFSYSVSHDLRAPLRGIDGFSEVLMRRYHDKLDASGRDYLERVRRASQRMGQLIDDLLNLSRVTRGPLMRKEVDLAALARAVVEELRRAEPERQVEVILDPGPPVFGDPGLLRVLLDNLLGNAWKFTRHSPHPRIEFGMREEDGERVLHVRDNGAGFDPAYADKLFQVFQRLHAQSEFEGTGIGLATVQRIVRRHHGRVWAEGAPGAGACLHFTLPQRERTRDNDAPASADTPAPPAPGSDPSSSAISA